MSELSELIKKTIDEKGINEVHLPIKSLNYIDSSIAIPVKLQVLRDVAIGFREKGFFVDSTWSEILVKTFENVTDGRITEASITENEHEISNSFVVSFFSFSLSAKCLCVCRYMS